MHHTPRSVARRRQAFIVDDDKYEDEVETRPNPLLLCGAPGIGKASLVSDLRSHCESHYTNAQIHALAEDIDRLRRLERSEQAGVDVKHVKVLEYGADEHRTKALVESILKGEGT